jgi:hypothetical protein
MSLQELNVSIFKEYYCFQKKSTAHKPPLPSASPPKLGGD